MSIAQDLILDAALADMREGRRVVLISANREAIGRLIGSARAKLLPGEKLLRSVGNGEITRVGGGLIRFLGYTGTTRGVGRGMTVDRVHVDHSVLWDELAPMLATAAPGLTVTHH